MTYNSNEVNCETLIAMQGEVSQVTEGTIMMRKE